MKKMMLGFVGVVMSVSLAACSPTDVSSQTNAQAEGQTVEASIEQTEREGVEKLPDADAEPMAQVSIFTIRKDGTGLDQKMDAIESDEEETVDAQLLADKMAEYGILEEGTKVLNFSQAGDVLTVDLSGMPDQEDVLEQTAVANTFIQNFEAQTLNLTVNGESVGSGSFEFNRSYKNMSGENAQAAAASGENTGAGEDEESAGSASEVQGETAAE